MNFEDTLKIGAKVYDVAMPRLEVDTTRSMRMEALIPPIVIMTYKEDMMIMEIPLYL